MRSKTPTGRLEFRRDPFLEGLAELLSTVVQDRCRRNRGFLGGVLLSRIVEGLNGRNLGRRNRCLRDRDGVTEFFAFGAESGAGTGAVPNIRASRLVP